MQVDSCWQRLQKINSFDISPSGTLGIHAEGDLLYCWNSGLNDRDIGGIARAHLLDIYTVRLFPSGQVILSYVIYSLCMNTVFQHKIIKRGSRFHFKNLVFRTFGQSRTSKKQIDFRICCTNDRSSWWNFINRFY